MRPEFRQPPHPSDAAARWRYSGVQNQAISSGKKLPLCFTIPCMTALPGLAGDFLCPGRGRSLLRSHGRRTGKEGAGCAGMRRAGNGKHEMLLCAGDGQSQWRCRTFTWTGGIGKHGMLLCAGMDNPNGDAAHSPGRTGLANMECCCAWGMDNPSVRFADSSLCTREPGRGCSCFIGA